MRIDDTDTNPGADDTPVPSNEEVAEPESGVEGESEEVEETNPDDELEDYEHEGKKASIPKWLKPQIMMQADYTKKTQEVAETRKSYEAKVAAIAQREQAFAQDAQEYTHLMALDQAIRQYEQQIPQLRQQGQVDIANRYWQDLMEMRTKAGQLAYTLQQKQQARGAEAERERANRIKERDAALAKEIQGFTPALMSKIEQYAISDGYTPEEAQSLIDPRYAKTLNKARLWDEYQAKAKQAAAKAKQEEQPVVTATPTVAARKPPERLTADLAKRDAGRWIEMRNKQLAAKRGR